MKKFIYTIIAMLGILMPTSAWAQSTSGDEGSYREAYAVLEVTAADDGSITDAWITLYYDDLKSTRKGTVVDLDKMLESPEIMQTRQQLHSVIIDQSFADCRPTSTAGWFGYCFELKTIAGLEYLNTSEVTDMTGMFMECGVDKLNLSNFNTSKVTTMNNMFAMCRELVGVDISSFDTSNVTDMSFMFGGCSSLTTIIAGDKWSTDKVTEGDYMFGECTSIVGGNGTTYDENHTDPSYARIDKEGQPGYFTQGSSSGSGEDDIIQFVDSNVKAICVQNWDSDGDGELSKTEAAAVTDIGTTFKENTTIGSFNELKYFTGLQSLSMHAFENSSVTSLELPVGLIEIGSDAFSQCRQLKSIFISATVSKMGSDVDLSEFWMCPKLETISVDANNEYYTAVDNVMFNKDMTKIIRYASAKSGESYEIPSTVTYINQNCFESCNNLVSLSIPSSVNTISSFAFQGCSSLQKVDIADGVSIIGEDAFRACTSLKRIYIPASVYQIGREDLSPENAFIICKSLEEIIVDENNPWFMSEGGILYSKDKSIIVAYPSGMSNSEFIIPYGVTKIARSCFSYAENLTGIQIPETVVDYGSHAIYLPKNTLQRFVVMATTPASIEKSVFSDSVYSATLYVPSGCISSYAAAEGWKEFEYIFEYTSTSGKVETPTFSFSGDSLVISTTTEDALIWYQSAAIDSTFEDGFAQYSGPIVVGDVKMNAKATKDGMEDSEVASMVYYYTEWQELMETTYECEALLTQIEASNPSDEILEMVRSLYTEIAYVRDVYDRDRLSWDRDKISEEISKLKLGASEIEAKWREQQVDVTYADCTLTVGGNTTMDAALEQVGGRAEVAKTIAAIVWNSTEPLTKSDLDGLIDNPNLLIYVKADSLAPEGVNNVIIDGKLKELVLVDADGNNNFSAPQTFTVENISYTREFKQTTEKDVSRGWEGICLPFDVQTYTHETHGAIAPFRSNASEFHFWLHEMTENGMVLSTGIEANKPYIISMPNNITYPATYNQAGKVTFAAKNVTIEKSEAWMIHNSDGSIGVAGIYFNLEKNASYYALNVGEEVEGNPEGSVFVSNYRDIHPFEVYTYHTGRNARSNIISLSSLFGGKDGSTGIIDIMENQDSDVVKVYSINGTLIKKGNRSDVMNGLPKGLYIIGNQKVMVK